MKETSHADSRELKFAADRMLGRLAKWLRILGRDVSYGRHLSGYGLIHAARQENRIILTRDRHLRFMQPPEFVYIESDDFRQQLRQLMERFRLTCDDALFTRCLSCNSLLRAVAKASIKDKVPEYVFLTQEKFSCCPDCQRIYWAATHHVKMVQQVRELELG
jgi:uncharacterized protein